MAAKSVLVSYNGRNILLTISQNPSNRSDLEYLDDECRKMFSFCSNVHINLTFQKFDPEWEMYIDLESDYVAKNKDKLNMVVTPQIVDNSTPAQSVSSSRLTLTVSITNKINVYKNGLIAKDVCLAWFVCVVAHCVYYDSAAGFFCRTV